MCAWNATRFSASLLLVVYVEPTELRSSKPPGGSSGSDLRDGLLVSASSGSMEQGEGVSMLRQQHVQFTPPTDRGQSCAGPPHAEPFLVLA